MDINKISVKQLLKKYLLIQAIIIVLELIIEIMKILFYKIMMEMSGIQINIIIDII